MSKVNIARLFLAFSLVAIAFFGCVKEEFDLNKLTTSPLSPEIGAPVVYTELSLEDMIYDIADTADFIRINPDKSLSLVYSDTLLNMKANEVFDIPTQSDTMLQEFSFTGVINPGDQMMAERDYEYKFTGPK